MNKRQRMLARQRIGDLPQNVYAKLKEKSVIEFDEFIKMMQKELAKANKRIEELEQNGEPVERERG